MSENTSTNQDKNWWRGFWNITSRKDTTFNFFKPTFYKKFEYHTSLVKKVKWSITSKTKIKSRRNFDGVRIFPTWSKMSRLPQSSDFHFFPKEKRIQISKSIFFLRFWIFIACFYIYPRMFKITKKNPNVTIPSPKKNKI